MDEKKPVELNDEQLESVAGGYYWNLTYKKGDTIEAHCTGCNSSTTQVCTSPTERHSKGLIGWTQETTFVCTNCGKGNPIVINVRRS